MARTLRKAHVPALERGGVLVGTGGTVRNLAKIDRRHARVSHPTASRLHGGAPRGARDRGASRLAFAPDKRERVPGLSDERSDSIVGGALAILALMEHVGAKAVRVSGRGVREGMALALISRTLPRAGSGATGLRRDADIGVPRMGPGHGRAAAGRRERRCSGPWSRAPRRRSGEALDHAALVLDIGRSIDFFDRHDHVADIVVATDLEGFSHRQVALLVGPGAPRGQRGRPCRRLRARC